MNDYFISQSSYFIFQQFVRLDEQNRARTVLVAVVEGRRQRGRPKLRWEDGVRDDAKKLNAAKDRNNWRKLRMKALAQKRAVVPVTMMMIVTIPFY
jgi:hypothetical protein